MTETLIALSIAVIAALITITLIVVFAPTRRSR